MKPDLETPDTLILAIWHADGQAALIGSLRSCAGELRADIQLAFGALWPTLAATLDDLAAVGAHHLLVVSNDLDLVRTLRTLRPPQPDQVQRVFVLDPSQGRGRGHYLDVPYGGDADHWRVIARLATTWAGCCAALHATTLPKASALWQQHCSPKIN